LSYQTGVLSDLAARLGRSEEGERWRTISDELLDATVRILWNEKEDQFISRRYDGLEVICDSSQMLIPLILGKRLPQAVIDSLIRRLEPFITPHGVASELPSSPYYEPDGHCRGSIWAPPTFFLANGCRSVGRDDIAGRIEENYCSMLAREGFNECFDALAGTAQRELAYSWTANVFLMFLRKSD